MNHAIEVRAQVVTIEGDKATLVLNLPAVGMVFQVQPPADPLLIPQLARLQAGYQLNSLARPLELLVQEAAHAATGQPRITSKDDAEAITAQAVEVSEDTLVPEGVESTADYWQTADGSSIIQVHKDHSGNQCVSVSASLPLAGSMDFAQIIAAQIFLIQHGRLPYIGGGLMV